MSEDSYTDLSNEENFECMNIMSHKFIHWIARYRNWRDVLNNIYKILEKMEKLNAK